MLEAFIFPFVFALIVLGVIGVASIARLRRRARRAAGNRANGESAGDARGSGRRERWRRAG